ncbi:MAG TPA: GatB/YqeY domain-containing protein [Terracidiphilus sp.]|nr:GatB/YqeY domain-containing protein [Terracidiphilus sp.]
MIDPGALAALITKQTVTAMKARDAERTGTLRLIKAALMNKALERNAELTPAEEQQTLTMMIKQRRDSIEQFTKGNRPELAAKEAAEIVVIEEFLPKALDEAGLRAMVAEVVEEHANATGRAATAKDMGPVIKAVQARLQQAGVRAEGRIVSEMVKQGLAG